MRIRNLFAYSASKNDVLYSKVELKKISKAKNANRDYLLPTIHVVYGTNEL